MIVAPSWLALRWSASRCAGIEKPTWAIHIHGLGRTRAGTLREVRVATELGHTSLVVSYRNTPEGPRVGTGRTTLGHTETSDVDEAIGFAVRRGAQRVVLFRWSMGAGIALQLADHPRHEELIARSPAPLPRLDRTICRPRYADPDPPRRPRRLRSRPDLVELETFEVGHTLCWNTDRDRWREAVTAWLEPRVPR